MQCGIDLRREKKNMFQSNYLYLFLKSTYREYIFEKKLSTSEVEPILALIAPSPL
jgi:hypothetical protein